MDKEQLFESILNEGNLEENYQDYDAAVYRAEAVVKSMSRDFDKETVRMAFEKVLGL